MVRARTNTGAGLITLLVSVWVSARSDVPALRPEGAVVGVHPHHHHHDDERHHHHHHHYDPPVVPAPAPTTEPSERTEGCPESMLRVAGDFCPEVREECLEMADDDRERCLRFRKPTRCRSRRTEAMDFCIDRYEWPGREGSVPQVLRSWNDAERLCREAGRRLCTEDEWTLACEGPGMLPYPWGYVRDETACNIDRHNLAYDHDRVTGHDRDEAESEAARVSQARASGSFPRCVSPYGVHDMTGNVDEWTVSRTGDPFRSALKGGYWGRVRARCRATTRRHDEGFRYYQIGFRCCASPTSGS